MQNLLSVHIIISNTKHALYKSNSLVYIFFQQSRQGEVFGSGKPNPRRQLLPAHNETMHTGIKRELQTHHQNRNPANLSNIQKETGTRHTQATKF